MGPLPRHAPLSVVSTVSDATLVSEVSSRFCGASGVAPVTVPDCETHGTGSVPAPGGCAVTARTDPPRPKLVTSMNSSPATRPQLDEIQ